MQHHGEGHTNSKIGAISGPNKWTSFFAIRMSTICGTRVDIPSPAHSVTFTKWILGVNSGQAGARTMNLWHVKQTCYPFDHAGRLPTQIPCMWWATFQLKHLRAEYRTPQFPQLIPILHPKLWWIWGGGASLRKILDPSLLIFSYHEFSQVFYHSTNLLY